MLRGGSDLVGPVEIKDRPGEKPKGPSQVKGVVNEAERSNKTDMAGVDIGGLLEGSGMQEYGSSMGQNLAGRSAPYLNRSLMGSSGGALDRSAEMHAQVLENMSGKIPVPNQPRARNSRMGTVSGFSWRNLGKKTSRSQALNRLGNQRPRYQLSETFTMAGMALSSTGSEYEATYIGATYDGTDVDADVLGLTGGEAVVPTTPNASFAGDLLSGIDEAMQAAAACTEATGTHGAKVSEDSEIMQSAMDEMDFEDPPGCCWWDRSERRAWNRNVTKIVTACNDSNVHAEAMSLACGNAQYERIECNDYADMEVECHWWSCAAEIFAWVFVSLLFGVLVTVLLATGVFGEGGESFIKGMVRWMSGYDSPEAPEDDATTVGKQIVD